MTDWTEPTEDIVEVILREKGRMLESMMKSTRRGKVYVMTDYLYDKLLKLGLQVNPNNLTIIPTIVPKNG